MARDASDLTPEQCMFTAYDALRGAAERFDARGDSELARTARSLAHSVAIADPLMARGPEPRGDTVSEVERCPHCSNRLTSFVPAEQLTGAVEVLRLFAIADAEFVDDVEGREPSDDIQVLVGISRAEAATIRAIVAGHV